MYTVGFFIRHPRMIGNYLVNHTCWLWPDELYLRLHFFFQYGYFLNLKNPKGYNEKCQWMKLYYKRPDFPDMVGKYTAKKWAAERIGDQYIVPCYGVWDHFDDIDFDQLPNQFILKVTHDSGGNAICRDKATFDKAAAKRKLEKALQKDTYKHTREWPYKYVKRAIIAEQLLVDPDGDGAITDYKFFCFNGEPKVMYVSKDGSDNPRTDFFDMDWNHLPIRMRDLNADVMPEKPAQFDEMKRLATILSKGLPHVRVDFYLVGQRIYFGEMTLWTSAGFTIFNPWEWNDTFGSWIQLPKKITND